MLGKTKSLISQKLKIRLEFLTHIHSGVQYYLQCEEHRTVGKGVPLDMPPVCFAGILIEARDLTEKVLKRLRIHRSGSSVAQEFVRGI